MQNISARIVIDTNWLISYLIRPAVKLHMILETPLIHIYSSPEQFLEFERKISADKFRKYFTQHEALNFLDNFKKRSTQISLVSIVNVCRDPKDNYLLSLSKDTKADFLITGDRDLLVLKNFEDTKIVTLTEFIEHIQN